ncbi:MarR family winged helix-turn-helix transcriptional regulator [Sedimentitalea todarodis]|uniref:MarR family transcriptional regulator n=1 Tax=Sedimentitalea todarodis TaxID=1631240 RepID=A0ABU3VLV7_9RHOB|nr:MarR family transcriptional regulator [Sedimentitalea todarodis]MDU9007156.1 MarR family transcriptional regulator [Sedimentitalea todarodis]
MIDHINHCMNDDLKYPKDQSIHQSLGYWTSLTARTMEAEFNKRLAHFGITRVAWVVLGAIHFDEKSSPSELAEFLSIDRAAITRLLDKLEQQGLIIRCRTDEDRRSVSLLLTPKGEALSVEIARESKAVNAQFSDGLTPEEVEQYIGTVKKILANGNKAVTAL